MAQRYIYLSDELNAKLKLEDNASGLISRLLTKYYELERGDTLQELDTKLERLQERKAEMLKALDEDMNRLAVTKEQVERQVEFVETKKQQDEQKALDFEQRVRNNFAEITGRAMTDLEFSDFKERWDTGEAGFNLFKFLQERGLYAQEETPEDTNA